MTEQPDPKPITNAQFARYAAYMASHVAQWVAEVVAEPDQNEPMGAEPIKRFTDRITRWLEAINGKR